MINKEYQTKVRSMISEYFRENHDKAITFSDLNGYLLENDVKVNKTTIYRYLDKLCKDSVIKKYQSEDGGQSAYILILSNHCIENHLHMKCMKCNKVIHLDCEFNKEILDFIKTKYDFKIDCTQTILYGICEECEKSQ